MADKPLARNGKLSGGEIDCGNLHGACHFATTKSYVYHTITNTYILSTVFISYT